MVNQDVLIAEYNTLRAELIQTIQMNVPGLLKSLSFRLPALASESLFGKGRSS